MTTPRLGQLSTVLFVIMTAAAVAEQPRCGDGVLLMQGKQLFIDDHLIDELRGLRKVLNQPVKHPANPLAVPDLPWEEHGYYANGCAMYDEDERLFKIWVHLWKHVGDELAATKGLYGYLTSKDGVTWQKPIINSAEKSNRVLPPDGTVGFSGQGVMKDPEDGDPSRRYKMVYTNDPGKTGNYETCVAYSPDGIAWTAEERNPVIPFGDTQNAPLWDARRQSFLAFVRTGPPNVRGIARVESRDFVHWSPKVTVFPPGSTKLDQPFRSNPYGMKVMPYANTFIGLINTYHWETLGPIPEDKLWQDKLNVQLAFSRNGLTWSRVGPSGAIPHADLDKDLDWETIARNQVFLQYGEHKREWDWGQVYAYHAPIVHDDKIWIYYTGLGSRHWSNYHGDDRPPKSGIGLATLRLDGFVSVEPLSDQQSGQLTTKPFLMLGDRIEVNADASDGSLTIEVLDAAGEPIDGFAATDCEPLRRDSIHHEVTWSEPTSQLRGQVIRLRINVDRAKLYSVTIQ